MGLDIRVGDISVTDVQLNRNTEDYTQTHLQIHVCVEEYTQHRYHVLWRALLPLPASC